MSEYRSAYCHGLLALYSNPEPLPQTPEYRALPPCHTLVSSSPELQVARSSNLSSIRLPMSLKCERRFVSSRLSPLVSTATEYAEPPYLASTISVGIRAQTTTRKIHQLKERRITEAIVISSIFCKMKKSLLAKFATLHTPFSSIRLKRLL